MHVSCSCGATYDAIHPSEMYACRACGSAQTRLAVKQAGSFEDGIARIQSETNAQVLKDLLAQNDRLRGEGAGSYKLDMQDQAARLRLNELGHSASKATPDVERFDHDLGSWLYKGIGPEDEEDDKKKTSGWVDKVKNWGDRQWDDPDHDAEEDMLWQQDEEEAKKLLSKRAELWDGMFPQKEHHYQVVVQPSGDHSEAHIFDKHNRPVGTVNGATDELAFQVAKERIHELRHAKLSSRKQSVVYYTIPRSGEIWGPYERGSDQEMQVRQHLMSGYDGDNYVVVEDEDEGDAEARVHEIANPKFAGRLASNANCPRCNGWKPGNPLGGGPPDPPCTCSYYCGQDWCEAGAKRLASVPTVTDAQVSKFQGALSGIGYTVGADEAHDILLLNGGYQAAMNAAGVVQDVASDIRGSGDLPTEAGWGLSSLVETTDGMSWYYRQHPLPTESEMEAMRDALRTQSQKDSITRQIGYAKQSKLAWSWDQPDDGAIPGVDYDVAGPDDPEAWAQAMAQAGGDEQKAMKIYTELIGLYDPDEPRWGKDAKLAWDMGMDPESEEDMGDEEMDDQKMASILSYILTNNPHVAKRTAMSIAKDAMKLYSMEHKTAKRESS